MFTLNRLLAMSMLIAPVLSLSVACTQEPDAGTDVEKPVTPRIMLIPEPDENQAMRRAILGEVETWFYLLDSDLAEPVVEQIAGSEYDLVVIDFISSESGNADYPMADMVKRIQEGGQGKIVLAYIDIGEVESYRAYWREDWHVGDPEWIAGDDPDGWQENYPVAFWNDEWREIWLGPSGLIRDIVTAGFDGVYLDWIEAYSDENVLELAQDDGLDAKEEMVQWVSDLAQAGRERVPEFIVIGQNAAELLENPRYFATIDGIAQEQVWFDGGADNQPPGDCPLPRSEEEIESTVYRKRLTAACRRQYDDFPESTLHVSSEWYLDYLEPAQASGLPIFTVDYALDPANITWIYETSRARGFVPFVSNRALDTIVEPYK